MANPAISHGTAMEIASLSDKGPTREHNEDNIVVVVPDGVRHPDKGTMLIVADGLGGHNAGEVASAIVVDELPKAYYGREGSDYFADLCDAIDHVNKCVFDSAADSELCAGMGSTLVVALIVSEFLVVANVGDSRAYLFRERLLHRLTIEHVVNRSEIFWGGADPEKQHSHVLTKAVGAEPFVLPSVGFHRIREGDCVLLCSDGLTDALSDGQIQDILSTYPVAKAVRTLMDRANEQHAGDNVSVILAKVVGQRLPD